VIRQRRSVRRRNIGYGGLRAGTRVLVDETDYCIVSKREVTESLVFFGLAPRRLKSGECKRRTLVHHLAPHILKHHILRISSVSSHLP
jgi:hypothetical protein